MWLQATVTFCIGKSCSAEDSAFLCRKYPCFQSFLIVGAKFGIDVVGNSPHYILCIPANAGSARAGTSLTVHFTFHACVVHNVLDGSHHAVETHNRLSCEIGNSCEDVLLFFASSAIVCACVTFNCTASCWVGCNIGD